MKEALNERFRRLRLERGLSSKDMAQVIDVAESTYREWEKGRGLAKLPPFQKMSEVLAVSVTELLTGEVLELGGVLNELKAIEERLAHVRVKLGSRI